MKKIMIIIPITFVIAVIFGAAVLSTYIGTLESVYAQTNTTNTIKANKNYNTTTADVGSAGDLENLTSGNTGLSQNRGDIANPTIGLAGGLEKEQINDTEGNMTTADKTAGQNITTTINGGDSSSSNANTTTTANNTSANQTSSENKTGNPLSNVPIIGDLFK
jgi:hypothetical protein